MATPPDPPPPPPPSRASSAARRAQLWADVKSETVRLFHAYGSWLVGISWTRFLLLSLLLLIAAGVLSDIAQRPSGGTREEVTITPEIVPAPPTAPTAPESPVSKTPGVSVKPNGIRVEKHRADGSDVVISIDSNGVRISPRDPSVLPHRGAASAAAASSAEASASSGASIRTTGDGVEIRLPPGADSEAVRDAVKEARDAVVEAINDAKVEEESAAGARAAAQSGQKTVKTIRRVHDDDNSPPLVGLAFLWVVASAILKVSYKGTLQAETKAAVATETAESEQLKRQVVEARMAAMQAQVEQHFLFNTLASIDHLIETDPPRASQMQKNLIALLRASMPSMRDASPQAHNLGREMAVIRPYLEILKVRMEDRLQTSIRVPEGLLSAEFPSMMIQSLVENAIKHGLEPKAEGGQLDVSAEIVHGNLAVTVADTGMGFGKAATSGTGIGLANIRERLKLLYGKRASVLVADNSPSGTVVTLTVPYQAQARPGATS